MAIRSPGAVPRAIRTLTLILVSASGVPEIEGAIVSDGSTSDLRALPGSEGGPRLFSTLGPRHAKLALSIGWDRRLRGLV